MRPNGKLIIGGQTFNVDAPVVNWHESGWDATSPNCIVTKTDPAPACRPAAASILRPAAVHPVPRSAPACDRRPSPAVRHRATTR